MFSGLQNIETITVNNPEKDRVNYLRIRNENKINSHSF